MDDNLIPVIAMLTPVAIVAIIVGFRYLAFAQRQKTLRLALEKGLDSSAWLARDPHLPLRRRLLIGGVLWSAAGLLVGVAVTMMVLEVGLPRYIVIFGWIPAAVGAAELILARLTPAEEPPVGAR